MGKEDKSEDVGIIFENNGTYVTKMILSCKESIIKSIIE